MVFVQQVIQGLSYGALYAALALGLVLIFRTMDVVNFANGEMAMVSAFMAFVFLTRAGLPLWVAIILAIAFAGVFGALIERIIMRPIEDAPVISMTIVTMGMVILFNGIALWIWGGDVMFFPPLITGAPVILGGVIITRAMILELGLTLSVALSIYLVLQRTKVGLAIRAISQRPVTARLMGVPVNRIYSVTWAMAGMLGAFAAVMITRITGLHTNMMGEISIMAFTAAVLGGFSSLLGAVVGGLILGVLEGLISLYISPSFKTTIAFAIIILVLWVKPSGLLGTAPQRKV